MQKLASINTRVDPALKEQAEAILDELGMSMSTAMGLFLKQIVIYNGIPFDVCLPPYYQMPSKRGFSGSDKNRYDFSDDDYDDAGAPDD